MLGLDLSSSEPVLVAVQLHPDGQFEVITPSKNISVCAAIALPENEVFSRILPQDTQLSDTEILQRLYAGFADINQPLAVDFQRLGENKILAMAATKEKIKQHCEKAPKHLKIIAVESEAYAIARALKKTGKIPYSSYAYGFSYTENNKTKLYIFKNNYLIYYGYTLDLFEKFYPEFDINTIKLLFLDNKPYLLALGLALRDQSDLNLLPWREENARLARRRRILFIIKAVLIGLILGVLIKILINYYAVPTKNIRLSTPVATSAPAISSAVTPDLQQQQASQRLLNNLSHAMPEGVFLTQLNFNNPAVELSGQAVTQEQVNTLINNLKNSSVIQNPVLNTIQPDNTEPPYNFNFLISASALAVPSAQNVTTPVPVLPQEKDFDAALEFIQKTAESNHLQITLRKSGTAIQRNGYTEIPVQITLVGTYQQILDFITLTSRTNWQGPLFIWKSWVLSHQYQPKTTVLNETENNDLLQLQANTEFFYKGAQR